VSKYLVEDESKVRGSLAAEGGYVHECAADGFSFSLGGSVDVGPQFS
jgi:hypothetical protein